MHHKLLEHLPEPTTFTGPRFSLQIYVFLVVMVLSSTVLQAQLLFNVVVVSSEDYSEFGWGRNGEESLVEKLKYARYSDFAASELTFHRM